MRKQKELSAACNLHFPQKLCVPQPTANDSGKRNNGISEGKKTERKVKVQDHLRKRAKACQGTLQIKNITENCLLPTLLPCLAEPLPAGIWSLQKVKVIFQGDGTKIQITCSRISTGMEREQSTRRNCRQSALGGK